MVRSLRRALAVGGGAAAVVVAAVTTVNLAASGAPEEPAPPVDRPVTTGIGIPWGITFLPDGSAYVSERDSFRILRVTPNGARTVVGTVPGGRRGGEGGLLGLAVSPGFASDGRLFAFQTTNGGNRIVRIQVTNHRFTNADVTTIFDRIRRSTFHNGGRLQFGPDGNLYVGTGDADSESRAQDPASANGKILRMTPDGRPPTNPPNRLGGVIFSMGFRNVQGLAFDSRGRLWASEFGPSTVDELNLIENGRNYGWGGCRVAGPCVNAVRTWPVAFASPSGITIVNDNIFLACLRGQKIIQLRISGNTVTGETVHHTQFGRVRTVERAPGGGYWMSTSNRDANGTPGAGDDRIIHVS
jgi:glucose/arabinose dehydrogenase